MAPIRIYLHAPQLPSRQRSRDYIVGRLGAAGLGPLIKEYNPDPTLYEYSTLAEIWRDAQHEDFYALYLHVKGASKTEEDDLLNAEAWMDFMLYGVVDNWQKCVDHLTRGADLVGSLWHWHFKGNFWWGKSAYLRHLPNPMSLLDRRFDAGRFNAEYWCAWGLWKAGFPKPAVKNLFYVKSLGADSNFSLARGSAFPPALDERHIFVDRRLDSAQSETVEEFLGRRYFCAFDEIQVPSQRECLYTQLTDFLNYDGQIIEADRSGQTMDYRSIA